MPALGHHTPVTWNSLSGDAKLAMDKSLFSKYKVRENFLDKLKNKARVFTYATINLKCSFLEKPSS